MYKILKNIIEMDDYSVQKLSKSQPPEPFEWNTVEGTELNVSDCIGGKGKIAVKGNTYQKQLSGKNLFDKNNIILNYRLSQEGKGTPEANYFVSPYIKVNPNTIYTKNSSTQDAYHRFAFYTSNDDSTTISVSNDNTITTPSNCEYLRFCGLKDELNTTQLEQGPTVTNYEEYCGGQASPNPDYPQEIKVVTGNNVIKQVGKNLANSYRNIWYSTNSNTFTSNNNFRSCMAKVKPNTTYVISKKNISNRYVVITSSEKIEPDVPIRKIIVAKTNPNYTEYSFTTQADENYVFFGYYSGSNEEEIELAEEEIMIEEGSTPTTYEQYQEKNYNLNLSNIELCKIGDYQDILFKNIVGDENYNAELEEGAWYKKKIIDKKILTDLLNWSNYGTNRFSVEITAPNGDYRLSALCDRYIQASSWANHLDTDKNFIVRNGNWGENKCRISFRDSDYSSLTDWKQFVSENNLTVYHELLTPTYEQITDPTLISQLEALRKAKWFKGVNHWWTETENLEPVLKGTYKQIVSESEGE